MGDTIQSDLISDEATSNDSEQQTPESNDEEEAETDADGSSNKENNEASPNENSNQEQASASGSDKQLKPLDDDVPEWISTKPAKKHEYFLDETQDTESSSGGSTDDDGDG